MRASELFREASASASAVIMASMGVRGRVEGREVWSGSWVASKELLRAWETETMCIWCEG